MNHFIILIVLATVAITDVISETPVYQCSNNVPLPLNTQINNCEILPCSFPQGSDVILNTTFSAISYIDKFKPEVIAYVLGIQVNYPLNEPDGCNGLLNSRCPIEEGEKVTYQLRMPILTIFPQISLALKFTLYSNGVPITCFMVDAKVVGSNDN